MLLDEDYGNSPEGSVFISEERIIPVLSNAALDVEQDDWLILNLAVGGHFRFVSSSHFWP